ncbi:pantetheine-phosphate adenylyltransferase family protein-like protein [Periconia macrospinosa]|uniref:Pantetheine-phosphate adenylyltransferase family protein-like protein n=1 Tax=Periconia macrospinosa TaxID=97972 RepID=A0A2V1D0Q8_9PLEO|nr:pantetheine-phosphate adenylyltransferase family protein-like protein [Periconia macrospinosa]
MPPAPQKPLHQALLLLPPGPSPPAYETLKAAYGPTLRTVLGQLARAPQRAQDRAVLDIALPCSHLYGRLDAPRRPFYAHTQSLVAGLYKLICTIAAQNSIDTEDAEGVDARVILLAYPRDGKLVQPSETERPERETLGPAIELHTLAKSNRPWDTIFSVESEEGEALVRNFLSFSPSSKNVQRVRGGIVSVHSSTQVTLPAADEKAPTNHHSVAVGGTFDHLHIGHKLLLTMFAFVLGRQHPGDDEPRCLTVGITGDALLKNKKYVELVESWDDRRRSTHDFLSGILHFGAAQDARIRTEEFNDPGPNGRAVHVAYPSGLVIKYVEIQDPFGPTITDESISALVISLETRSGGKAVNDRRTEKGWASLEVFEVDVLDAEEEGGKVVEGFANKLSSTEIRKRRSEGRGSTDA